MKKTIGHRGIDPTGETTYKKTTSSALKGAIQLGITHTVGSLSHKPERDVLMQDFEVVESIFFPRRLFRCIHYIKLQNTCVYIHICFLWTLEPLELSNFKPKIGTM